MFVLGHKSFDNWKEEIYVGMLGGVVRGKVFNEGATLRCMMQGPLPHKSAASIMGRPQELRDTRQRSQEEGEF